VIFIMQILNSNKVTATLTVLGIIAVSILLSQDWQDEAAKEHADQIYTNAEVVTINPLQAEAQAVAVKNGRIIAVGSNKEITQFKGASTEQYDLSGYTLMPGFIEPHTHPIASAILIEPKYERFSRRFLTPLIDLSGFSHPNPESLFQRLKLAVEAAEPGEWVLAFGLDPLLTKGLIPPDRHKLDEIAPNNPVFILSQVMHTAYVNSLALEKSGLDKSTVDPSGGHFEREADGNLSGILHESAIATIKYQDEAGLIEKLSQAWAARTALIDQYQTFADAGYTTIGVPGPVAMFEGYLDLLEHVASRESSPLRSYVYPMVDEMPKTDYTPGYQNGRFHVLGVKIYLDGSPWTGAMATAEPYLENTFTQDIIKMKRGNRGLLKETRRSLQQKVRDAHETGWQIAIHSHGERAHTEALDALENAQKQFGKKALRHRLEHLGLIRYEDLKRAAELGATPSFFIDHVYYFGEAVKNLLLGPERAERFMPLRWATELHDQVSIHTDNPATPIDPMRALKTSVTRVPRFSNESMSASQKMSVEDALEAITIDAAWQMHAEEDIGSIEVSKRADFTLLSANPRTTEPENWHKIKVLGTWLEGEQVSGASL